MSGLDKRRSLKALRAIAIFSLLSSATGAEPYSWDLATPPALVAPSDRTDASIVGASVQGALVDIRYGQVSIARSGTALVLDIDSNSVLTLNGRTSSEKELLAQIRSGISVYVRFNPDSGKIGWLDAISNSLSQKAAQIDIQPYKGPAYASGEQIRLSVSRTEMKRLGLKTPHFFLPGLSHALPTTPTSRGAEAVLKIVPGMDFFDLRVFVTEGGQSFRGKPLTISTTPPTIESFGPEVGSAKLPSLWVWVDHRSEAKLLDLQSRQLRCSNGGKIVEAQTTPSRSTFKLQVDGPGTYWVEFEIADKLGRRCSQRWPITIYQ